MNRDNFFENLRNDKGEHVEAIRAQRQLAYEERCIKRVFTECGIKINGWGRYANQCRESTGHDRLNFQWFNRQFASFPALLCGRRIPGLHELTLQDLFKPVDKNRLVKALSKALQKNEILLSSGDFVFVFPVVRTSFVAHSIEPGSTNYRILWSAYADTPLFIEPSKHFFAAVGGEWFEG